MERFKNTLFLIISMLVSIVVFDLAGANTVKAYDICTVYPPDDKHCVYNSGWTCPYNPAALHCEIFNNPACGWGTGTYVETFIYDCSFPAGGCVEHPLPAENCVCCYGGLACCGGGNPTPTPTGRPTPTPTSLPGHGCTIQGFKVLWPGNNPTPPAEGQTVTLNDPYSQTTNNWYRFDFTSGHLTRTVSVTVPAGYSVGSTLCYNDMSCHGGADDPSWVSGSSRDVVDDSYCGSANGYADLWWHYYPNTCDSLCDPNHDFCAGSLECRTVPLPGGIVANLCRNPSCELEDDCTCNPPTPTPTPTPPPPSLQCTVDFLPPNPNMTINELRDIHSSVVVNQGTADHVDYSHGAGIDSITPASHNLPPYTNTLTLDAGPNPTTVPITARVYDPSNNLGCTGNGTVTINDHSSWWRVVDADVFSKGNIYSELPSDSDLFDLDGPGGFPGIPLYTGQIDTDPGDISSTNWNAEAGYYGETYNFNYFKNKIEASVYSNFPETSYPTESSTFASGGYNWPAGSNYYWYKSSSRNSSLTLSGNIGSSWSADRKVILFVDRPITYGVNVNRVALPSRGRNMFMLVTNSNIVFPSSASGAKDGIYIADGKFITQSAGPRIDNAINFTGTVVGWGGIELNRDLPSNSNPAETFTYSPAQILQIPSVFARKSIIWKEVAP